MYRRQLGNYAEKRIWKSAARRFLWCSTVGHAEYPWELKLHLLNFDMRERFRLLIPSSRKMRYPLPRIRDSSLK